MACALRCDGAGQKRGPDLEKQLVKAKADIDKERNPPRDLKNRCQNPA
jgi:hypothetical protein